MTGPKPVDPRVVAVLERHGIAVPLELRLQVDPTLARAQQEAARHGRIVRNFGTIIEVR
jgi:hypothetical protein